MRTHMDMCIHMHARARVCVRAYVRAFVRECACACVWACALETAACSGERLSRSNERQPQAAAARQQLGSS